jgi:hypothetical protein
LALAGGQRKGFGTAIIFVAILPFFYAFLGFLVGGLIAFLYNAIAHAIGGIEIELEPSPRIMPNVTHTPASTSIPPPIPEVLPSASPNTE